MTSRTSLGEDGVRALEAAGLLTVEDGEYHPGDRLETLLPVLLALDGERDGEEVDGQPSDSVGDDPPTRRPTGADPTAGEMVGAVAHDLRGPLSLASGWLALARTDGDEKYFDGVAEAHARMADRVEDLVRLASDEADPEAIEEVSLAETADRVWSELLDEAVTETDRLVVEEDRTLLVVPDRLERLLANLFRNSLVHGHEGPERPDAEGHAGTDGTHAPNGGTPAHNGGTPAHNGGTGLTVRVGRLPDGFYVEDDGVGIPEDERDRVFTVGYSADGDGSGLGLASVAQVAAAHGWDVSLTEGTAGGARFEFVGVARPA